MQQLIIGICGYAGAGKDETANAILRYAEKIGPAARMSFADPMRTMLAALGVPHKYMVDRELKEKPVPGFGHSYRHLAQTLGTEWGRKCCGENFWLDAMAAALAKVKVDIVLIPDVRFPNEAQWLADRGGFLARVSRPGVAPVIPHESEAHVAAMEPQYELDNSGTLEELQEEAVEVLRRSITARVRARNGSAARYDTI
jgi:hypothetical protein